MSHLYAVRHRITAGNDFDGTLPSTTPVDSDGVRTYPPDTAGGLFALSGLISSSLRPVELLQVQLHLGGQSSWRICVADSAGDGDVDIAAGTAAQDEYIYEPAIRFYLTENQSLKVVTVNASAALHALVFFAPASIGGF